MASKTKKRPGQWIDDVEGAIGRFVHLETYDGIMREGRLSGLRTREVTVNGEARAFPVALELNGDPNDYIEFAFITRMKID